MPGTATVVRRRAQAGHPQEGRRQQGGSTASALALLLVIVAALGLNYVRNYRADQEAAKKNRPYAKYKTEDLQKLADGYRMELRAVEGQSGPGRVTARERYHLDEQVKEFERVQKAAERRRDHATEVAQMRSELAAIEAEQKQRAAGSGSIAVQLGRMFRI